MNVRFKMPPFRSKINVLFLTDCLADLAGGAEKQIYELTKRLDKDRFNICVVSLDCYGQASPELIGSAGAKLFVFRVKRVYGLSGLAQGLRFRAFLKTQKIDILQAYHFSSDMWGTFWGHLAGVPVIISNRRDMGFWRKAHHVWAYRMLNPWVKKIVVVADSVRKMVMREEGVPEGKVEVIYNGIEMQDTRHMTQDTRVREELGIQKNDTVVMHVANLKPVKGHQYLIEAMGPVVERYPAVKLVLVGEDELDGRLQTRARELGIARNVIFTGKREDARQLLEMADICVLPSLSEGMSNAILEYMAAGKPVIATRVGGTPELIQDGVNGILVEKEDAVQLSRALRDLLNDPEKRKAMGDNGLRRVKEEFAMAAMIGKYDRLFTTQLAEAKMAVLHLVSSGGLFGAERVILNLAKTADMHSVVGAIENTHNPHLEVVDEARKTGLNTVVFRSAGRLDVKTVLRVRRFLKKNKIDILHTHNYKSDMIGFLATRFTKTKWVATNHVWHRLTRKLRFYERMDSFVLRFAERVIAVSEEIKRDLLAVHIARNRVRVIDNGIDVDLFARRQPAAEWKARFGIGEGEPVVAMVGRLSPEKGHATFLKAAREVLRENPGVRFLIIGDGPIREDLEAEAKRMELDGRVLFTGVVEDMPSLYSVVDILANVSTIEGLPMTILEAMAAKVALIVTPVGAVPKVVRQDVNGVFVDIKDDESLAREILRFIERPNRRRELVEQAFRDVVEKYSFERMGEAYREVYGEVLK